MVYKVPESNKVEVVEFLIRGRDLKQVLVFSNTKIGASRLSRHLEQSGIKATAIHGDKTQQERMAALEAFKKGEIDVLVATDVAARGLDISDLPCVINYDLPYNAEDYVHRIGRTGRAGASGDAISVYSDKDERLLVDIEKLIKQTITRGELAGFTPSSSSVRRRRVRRATARRRAVRAPHAPSAKARPAPRLPERAPRSSSAPPPRRDKVDPWFLKPYEPATPAVAAPVASRRRRPSSRAARSSPPCWAACRSSKILRPPDRTVCAGRRGREKEGREGEGRRRGGEGSR